MISNFNRSVARVLLLIVTFSLTFQSYTFKKEPMKITPPKPAPTFTINDFNGIPVNLENYKGKKVLLTFYRNVGCPVCNLRFHEIQEQANYFKLKGLIILAVYESTSENMKQYLDGENFYATMIPNIDLSLYKLYEVEKSTGKIMKGMLHGAMGKMNKGKWTRIKYDC